MSEIRLSLIELMKYIGGGENSRTIIEGEAILNAGHIVLCGKSEFSDKHISVYALVLQTSAMNSNPHTIVGQLLTSSTSQSVKIGKWQCSCKAGNSGHCKHISGVLIKCSRENLAELELLSQTDIKCMWTVQNYETKEKYEAVFLMEMPCFQKKAKSVSLDFNEAEMQNFFISQLPESALAQHKKGRTTKEIGNSETHEKASEDLSELYTIILNNAAQSVIMLEIHSLNFEILDCCAAFLKLEYNHDPDAVIKEVQKSNLWRSARQFKISGSRCYDLYTYSKDEWQTKAVKYFWPKSFTNKYVKHGEKFEKFAREAFVSATGFSVVECGLVIPHNNKWLGFSPDGIIFENDLPVSLLEIKCVFEGSKMTITSALQGVPYLNFTAGEYSLKKRHKYYGQIQLGLSILNLKDCYLVLYASFDDSLKIIRVEYDYQFSMKMLSNLKEKYMKHMVHNKCIFEGSHEG